MGILSAVGGCSLIRLERLVPEGSGEVFVKLEYENPTGSMKDRMALGVIERAEADGRLRPGGSVLEYTGGSTGAALALVCAAKGYRIRIVSSDAFSPEKLDQMAAYGAELILVPSEGGRTTKKLILDMVEEARRLSAEPGTFWTNQLENRDAIAGYHPLAEELLAGLGGKIDAFVHSVGTAASLRGVAEVLRARSPRTRIAAVEPAESAVLGGGEARPHDIEGVGVGFVPPLWEPSLVDEILAVSSEESMAMARRLAREEGLFVGTSTGANVVAALRLAERLGPTSRIATLAPDSGLKYLETELFGRKRA